MNIENLVVVPLLIALMRVVAVVQVELRS